MRRNSKRFTSTVVRSAVAGAVVTGTVMAMAPAASASHKCDRSQEICYWRLSGYTGGSRAFTNEDYTYTNDYYDNLSPTKSIDNSISSTTTPAGSTGCAGTSSRATACSASNRRWPGPTSPTTCGPAAPPWTTASARTRSTDRRNGERAERI